MINKPVKNAIRIKRHDRIRNTISGTPEVPRLNVFRSNKHIYAQLIDDKNGVTIACASSKALSKELADMSTSGIDMAKEVGKAVAKAALDKGCASVVFDRGGYVYHGKVKALAEAAREAGLKF